MLTYLLIPFWFVLLTLPFLGISGSLKLGAVLLVCSVFVRVVRTQYIASLLNLWGMRIESFKNRANKIDSRLSVGVILLILILLPFSLNRYSIDIAIIAGIYIVLALGLNVVVGLTGLLALGYIAFYAVGAYTYALLWVHFKMPFWLGLPLGAIVAAFFGVLLGSPVLRLRGDYLAIVTLGFGEITRIVLNNWDEMTGGPNGIMGIGRPEVFGYRFNTPEAFYYLILVMAIFTAIAVKRLNESRIGRAWVAI